MEINFSCATLSNGILWSIRVTCILRVLCIPRKCKRRVRYSVVYHECISILYHATEKISGQDNQCDISVAHHGKVGCNIYRRIYNGFVFSMVWYKQRYIDKIAEIEPYTELSFFLFFFLLFCFVFAISFLSALFRSGKSALINQLSKIELMTGMKRIILYMDSLCLSEHT